MNKSESIKHLSAALFQFQSKAKKIIKSAENPFFKSKYADLPSILDEIHQPLQDCGLCISQIPDGDGLTTILIHAESGEFIEANATMKPVKNDPQSMGSAITYQRRYSICAILGLNVDEDDDGNNASTPQAKSNPQQGSEKPWLNKNTEQFNNAKKHIEGGGTIEDIKQHYRLSKEVEGLLK